MQKQKYIPPCEKFEDLKTHVLLQLVAKVDRGFTFYDVKIWRTHADKITATTQCRADAEKNIALCEWCIKYSNTVASIADVKAYKAALFDLIDYLSEIQ